MIKLEITPYERSILDSAIKFYTTRRDGIEEEPFFIKAMLEENIRILNDISDRMYKGSV